MSIPSGSFLGDNQATDSRDVGPKEAAHQFPYFLFISTTVFGLKLGFAISRLRLYRCLKRDWQHTPYLGSGYRPQPQAGGCTPKTTCTKSHKEFIAYSAACERGRLVNLSPAAVHPRLGVLGTSAMNLKYRFLFYNLGYWRGCWS